MPQRPDDRSPFSLLADVHAAIDAGELSRLADWLDVVGWVDDVPEAPRDDGRPERLLGVAEVMKRTGLGRTTLWNHERAGAFPRRVQLTTGRVAWRESDVAAWIASRPSR